jgi:hypothetical protein
MGYCSRVLLVAALVASFSGAASAQQKKTPGKKGVIELNDITIVGRVQKPVAAVDVARIRPKLALAEVRQPFVDRIEDAVYKEPF